MFSKAMCHVKSANGLQKQLTALYNYKYASLWHIIVSIPPKKVFIFNKRYTSECDNLYYGNNEIEKAEKINILGLYITLNILRMYWKKSSLISHQAISSCSREIVICYIGDGITYTIHLKYIKSTLGVREQTPTPAIYGDTGRFPLITRQHIKAVKYWCRILDLSQNHPVRNAYNMLLELDSSGFTNWCSRIRSVLEQTGLDQAWKTHHIGNANKFMLSFKDSLLEYLHVGGNKISRVQVSCEHIY